MQGGYKGYRHRQRGLRLPHSARPQDAPGGCPGPSQPHSPVQGWICTARSPLPAGFAFYCCLHLLLRPWYEHDCIRVLTVWEGTAEPERLVAWWWLPCSVVGQAVIKWLWTVIKRSGLLGGRWTQWGHNHCMCTRLPLAAFLPCSLWLCKGNWPPSASSLAGEFHYDVDCMRFRDITNLLASALLG